MKRLTKIFVYAASCLGSLVIGWSIGVAAALIAYNELERNKREQAKANY